MEHQLPGAQLQEPSLPLRNPLWRWVWSVVDGGERTAECYVRRFPIVAGLSEQLILGLEKHATATNERLPLCNEKVPGTKLIHHSQQRVLLVIEEAGPGTSIHSHRLEPATNQRLHSQQGLLLVI
jgi:hypothetical protein